MNSVRTFLSRHIPAFLTVLSVLLFLYVALRAYLVSLTHDECYTYLQYVRKTWNIASKIDYTNNHLLNTWFMKISSVLLGNSEFALRFPNLLFFAIYLFFGTKLILKLKNPLISFSGWILINCNPFMLDFFALARGYGISLGLLMISLYGLHQWITKDSGTRNTLMVLIPVCVAILANLTFVNVVIGFSVTLILCVLFYDRFDFLKEIKSNPRYKIILFITIISATTCFFAIRKIFKLKEHGNFDFGGITNIWDSTVLSLIGASLYKTFPLNDTIKGLILFFLAVISVLTILLFIRFITKKINALDLFTMALFLILIQCLGAIFLQHRIFEVPFAVDRAVIYLIPLSALYYVFVINGFKINLIRDSMILLPAIFALVIFILSANLTHTFLWRFDHNTKSIVKELGENPTTDPGLRSVMVGVHPIYWPSYNYYRLKYNFLQLNPAINNDDLKNKNYHFCLLSEDWKSGKLIKGERSGGFIAVRNRHLSNSGQEEKIFGGKEDRPFSSVLRDTVIIDSEYLLACYQCDIKTTTPQKDALIVLSVKRKEQLIFYKTIDIQEYKTGNGNWAPAVFSAFLPDSLKRGDEVEGYVWSKHKAEILIKNMNLTLFK